MFTDRQYIILGALGVVAICIFGCLGMVVIGFLARDRQTSIAPTDIAQENRAEQVEITTEQQTDTPAPPEPTATTEKATDTPPPETTAPSGDIPEPIEFTGSGNAVLDIEKGDYPAIITISGGNEGEGLIVTHYGADGEWLDLLVSATGPYVGIRPLDFRPNQLTKQIEVEAVGDWKMTIEHLSKAKVLEIPGIHNGVGDDVLIVKPKIPGLIPDAAAIKGNQISQFFAVLEYTGEGYFEVLVQSDEPYEGVVKVDSDLRVLDVRAEGDWIIGVDVLQSIDELEQAIGEPTEPPGGASIIIVTVDKDAEVVTLKNVSANPVDLGGWILLSELGEQRCALSGVIQPNDTLEVWALAARIDQGGYNCGFDANIWNNSETDPAVLLDQSGGEVFRVNCRARICSTDQ